MSKKANQPSSVKSVLKTNDETVWDVDDEGVLYIESVEDDDAIWDLCHVRDIPELIFHLEGLYKKHCEDKA